jgi:hypothetical protein
VTIIIKEVSMLHSDALGYIDRMLREANSLPDVPFGGKTLVLSGDWKQLTPVLRNSTFVLQCEASIKMSPLYIENFEVLE